KNDLSQAGTLRVLPVNWLSRYSEPSVIGKAPPPSRPTPGTPRPPTPAPAGATPYRRAGRGIRAPLRSVLGGIIARRLRLTEPWHFGLEAKTPVVLPTAGVFPSREIRMRKGKPRRSMSRREFGVLSAAALATPFIGFGSNESPANSATAD